LDKHLKLIVKYEKLLFQARYEDWFEPILVWAKLYILISWKHIYSIPVYFFSAVLLKCFMCGVKSVQHRY